MHRFFDKLSRCGVKLEVIPIDDRDALLFRLSKNGFERTFLIHPAGIELEPNETGERLCSEVNKLLKSMDD